MAAPAGRARRAAASATRSKSVPSRRAGAPRLPPAVRYSTNAATCYLIILFGNFGGAEFIYCQL